MRSHHLTALALLALSTSQADAQTAVRWFTVDGGGRMNCTGGNISVSGTFGQPDAGPIGAPINATMTGGIYAVRGGFWAGIRPPCAPDFNQNGTLEVQDIFDFLNAWFALDPRTDFNGVGGVTTQDIFDFLNAWFTGC